MVKRANHIRDQLATTLAITSPTDRDTLLRTIIERAVKLLRARSGGIYEYLEERGELKVIADSHRPENIDKVLKVGEGMAGQLVQSNMPFMIVNNYNSWSGRARLYAKGRRRFGAVLEVPLKWEKRIIGVLYIDDRLGRKFTPQEARLLALFANLLAIALINADIIAKDEEKLKRLERLLRATGEIISRATGEIISRATGEIISNVERATLDDLLTLIAKRAAETLEAEACGVFLVWQKGYLTLEASYGHREGGFQKGRTRVEIVSGIGSGLTGHIAHQRELFNKHGDALVNHFAVRRAGSNHTLSGECHSLLAIPLLKTVRDGEKLVGLLRLDNKKGPDNRPLPSLAFSVEDEWILSIFAEAVVMAIENSLFDEQLSKQQENLDRFLNSSANGIIAADESGNVVWFNKRAEEILGYQTNEVLYTSVEQLYFDSNEARRIGTLLRKSEDGKIRNFDTAIRNKAGEKVPIRLSATLLYDPQGMCIGSVGYFDRAIREILSLLLKASDIVDQAKDSADGLQKIAEILLPLFSRTFCRVLLRDDENQPLVVRAAHHAPGTGDRQSWKPGLGESLVVSQWRGLDKVLREGQPKVLTWSDKQYRPNLTKLARSLNLNKHIVSLLVVPLRIGGKNVGLLEIGELSEERPEFSQEEMDHISEVAAQTTNLILTSLYRITASHKRDLERLLDRARKATLIDEAVANFTARGDRDATLSSIFQGATEILECHAVVLYIYDQEANKFDYPPLHKELSHPRGIVQRKDVEPNSIVYKMLKRNTPYIVDDVAKNKLFFDLDFVKREKIVSCAAIPLKASGQKAGVLFVNYRTPHHFTETEIDRAELFGVQAAMAISNARIYEQAQKRAAVLRGLYNAGRAITGSLSLSETLDRIARQCLNIIDATNGEQKRFSHILLLTGPKLNFVAKYSEPAARFEGDVLSVDLSRRGERIGIVGRVVRTRAVANVGDVRRNKDYIQVSKAVRSQLAVPLRIGRRVIGVLSVEHPAPDAFSREDQKNVELLAAQAAIAIENARRHEYSENLYQAAQKIAKALDPREVLETVAGRARDILDADSAAIWSYDHVQDKFITREMVAVGIPDAELRRFQAEEPKPGRTAKTVLSKGWIGVDDPGSPKAPLLGNSTRSFLKRIGVRSFEGIALKVGGEPVGVLYVNYTEPRKFGPDDRRALENFAAYAALSLRRARLLDQITKVTTAAEGVAHATTLGDRDATLVLITSAAVSILNCDAVTLYEFDSVSGKLSYPPVHRELLDSARVKHPEGVSPNSIVRAVLRRKKPYFAEDVAVDPIFKSSRFAGEEKIKSCVAIPLVVRGHKVGVLFANYRSPHRFTKDETKRIQLFSLQVAVAISNAQLYDQAQKRLEALGGLYEANREITSSLNTEETLREIARQALQVIGPARKAKGCFSHVALKEASNLDFIWSSSPKILKLLRDESAPGGIKAGTGIAGRVARTGVATNVGDVRLDDDYVEINVDVKPAEKIRSQLSVPLRIGRRVIGVLSVEHPALDAFSQEDQKNVELLAAQAAVAIENARQFEALTRAKGQVGSLTALAWMGMANSVWGHAISQYAITTRLTLLNLRNELQEVSLKAGEREQIEERLNKIDTQTQQMVNEPITPPLSDEEGIESIFVNDYIAERMAQLEQSGQLAGAKWKLNLTTEDTAILCNRDWLGRAIDILVNNSVKAMGSATVRRLTVTTRRVDGTVEIAFTDTGKGIPRRIRRKLFREVIPRPFSKGMGIGLLILQAIAQAYEGYVAVGATGDKGTTMLIGFPYAEGE